MKITLKAARVNAGLTQEEAAKSMNIDRTTLINWEKGKTFPKATQLMGLCDIYNAPMDDIFLSSQST